MKTKINKKPDSDSKSQGCIFVPCTVEHSQYMSCAHWKLFLFNFNILCFLFFIFLMLFKSTISNFYQNENQTFGSTILGAWRLSLCTRDKCANRLINETPLFNRKTIVFLAILNLSLYILDKSHACDTFFKGELGELRFYFRKIPLYHQKFLVVSVLSNSLWLPRNFKNGPKWSC